MVIDADLLGTLINLYKEVEDAKERLHSFTLFPSRTREDRRREAELQGDLTAARIATDQTLAPFHGCDSTIFHMGVSVGMLLNRGTTTQRR
jgi:hypothetical protein